MKTIKEFQEVIGYEFENESLLRQALTHSSYANEKHMKKLRMKMAQMEKFRYIMLKVIAATMEFTGKTVNGLRNPMLQYMHTGKLIIMGQSFFLWV